jgi:hypothetical protein
MVNIFHGYVAPWHIDPSYLLHWVELSVFAVALLTLGGFAYAGFYYLYSNQTKFRMRSDKRSKSVLFFRATKKYLALSLFTNAHLQEVNGDES